MLARPSRRLLARATLVGVTALALAVPPSYAGDGTPTTCLGRTVTIPGSTTGDVVIGTFGSDVIATYAGNDVVRGEANFGGAPLGDADYICLAGGNDVADGGGGPDVVSGGQGNDVLDGGTVAAVNGSEDDTLIGGPGDDVLYGELGDDVIKGGPGNDFIDPPTASSSPPKAGADVIKAGSGDDNITEKGDGSVDYIDAGPGNDTCTVDATDIVENCETVNGGAASAR